jgi:AcrR family transcriptional regulator
MVDDGARHGLEHAEPPRRGRPPRYAPDERERRILEAMERVVAAAGLAGASMDAVAREAGMSKRTVYGVFGSRDALFEAWVRRVRAALVRPLSASERTLPLRERLERLLRREIHAAVAIRRLTVLRALIAEGPRQPRLTRAFLREGPDRAREIVREELDHARARGEIAVDDTGAAAAILWEMACPSPLEPLLDPEHRLPTPAETGARLALAVGIFLKGVGSRDGGHAIEPTPGQN